MYDKRPRQPNQKELIELQDEVLRQQGIEPENEPDRSDVALIVESATIAVFDKYTSDCPGYTGKVMSVIWGWPECYEVYVWRNGKISCVEQDVQFQRVEK